MTKIKVKVQKRDGKIESYDSNKIKKVVIAAGLKEKETGEFVRKIDKWAKRLNSREAVQLSRERAADSANASKQSLTRVSGPEDKDELRRRAGLVAGQPARHN